MPQTLSQSRSPLDRATDPLDPSIGLVALPGRRIELPLRAGDRVSGRVGDLTVATPDLLSRDQARQIGAQADHPGRYVAVDGPRRAVRLTGPDALLLGGLSILRPLFGAEPQPQTSRPVLQLGSRGPAVLEAQQKLNAVHSAMAARGGQGLMAAPLQADGIFGPATRSAVSAFQGLSEVNVGRTDGILDLATWTALTSWVLPQTDPLPTTVPATPMTEQAPDISASQIAANLAAITIATRTERVEFLPNSVDFNAIAYANTPPKRAIFRPLAGAQTEAQRTAAGEQVRNWLRSHGYAHNRALRSISRELRSAREDLAVARRRRSETTITQLEQRIADLTARDVAARAEVDRLVTAFQPYVDVTRNRHTLTVDGTRVSLHDHVNAYATVTFHGLEGQAAGDTGTVVENRLSSAITGDPLNILRIISRHEGTFSNVNTWDRAIVTFGFIQWTFGEGGDGSLVGLLAAIKRAHPQIFHDRLQRYGIDLFRNVVELQKADGTLLTGSAAAAFIQTDPKLTAVVSRLGTEPDVQVVQIRHAVATKIDAVRNRHMPRRQVTVGQLVTSSYGMGVMTDRVVGAGAGAVYANIEATLARYARANPGADYSREDWQVRVEPEVTASLASMDPQRAASYANLSHERGSFSA